MWDQILGAVSAFVSVLLITTAPIVPVTEPETQPKSPIEIRLEEFLLEKGSPIPASELVKYPNWRIILALSNAESGYGKYLAGTHNAWGVVDFRSGSKKFGKTRDFESWTESVKFVSELLFKYDREDGTPKPDIMVVTWKAVKPYEHWVFNVNHSLFEINQHVQPEVASTSNNSLL